MKEEAKSTHNFDFLKQVLLAVNTAVSEGANQVLAWDGKENKAFYPNVARGGGFYSQALPRYLVAVNKVERWDSDRDELCEQFSKLVHCRWKVIDVVIEGDIFTVAEKYRKVHHGELRYVIYDFGDLIATFTATIKRYESEEMPKEWLYGRMARLQSVGAFAYIVDGFGSRRHPRSVLRVKVVVKVEVQRVGVGERRIAVPEATITEATTKPAEAIQPEAEVDREVEERVKSLISSISVRE